MAELFFEDFTAGQEFSLGSHTLDQDAIVAFAREYDPQPFHVDEQAANQSIYGGLIASGWHSGAIYMRLLVDGLLHRVASMGSPGVDELRWHAPVRPGDTLSALIRIEGVRPSQSKPDRGLVMTVGELHNQDGVRVVSLKSAMMIRRRS